MSDESQQDIVEFLSRPESYGSPAPVETIVTHISRVFLLADRVYKLKRAVRFPYLDFTDVQVRKRACESELRLNRRTAPDLYLGVVAVTRDEGGRLSLGGEGTPLDWLVVMRRFDEDCLLDRVARRGGLTQAHMDDLAERLFRFHGDAEIDRHRGGQAAIRAVIDENEEVLARFARGRLDTAKIARMTALTRAQLDRSGALLDRRRAEGMVRRCHGDLHLRNIVLLDGRPTPFDCIEFSDDFAVIDVMYDLAFLLMDLEHRKLRERANALLNRTLDLSGDIESVSLLPLFLALRASVRCHVDAAQEKFAEAAEYLDLALGFLDPPPPRLIAVGGLSGSGKSSLGRVIAPALGAAPGAVVIRSDVTRKRLAGTGMYEKLGADSYTQEMSDRVYARLVEDARIALAAGHSAILDAVYAKPAERAAALALARELGVPFDGIWLDVPLAVRETRIGGRAKDASDATAEITRAQEAYDPGDIDWHLLDASADLKTLKNQALERLVIGITGRRADHLAK